VGPSRTGIFFAGIAQLVEQLICNQQVVGSNPSAGSSLLGCRFADAQAHSHQLENAVAFLEVTG
jgi:hypothetical protein